MSRLVPLLLVAAPPDAPTLDPARTSVVIAGVLQWPAGVMGGFPTKHRKDEELYEVLRSRGVPADRMRLLLDGEATYSGIRRAVREVGAASPADGTLVVYYCGHGFPAGGEVCLANFDVRPRFAVQTGLLASDLAGMVKSSFRGKRVLFLADCCFSGGLGKAAETLRAAGFEAASLTSASDSVVSTGNWTFTQTVIDALTGDTFADANGDGAVTLDELAAEVKAAMAALENQKHGYAVHGLPGGLRLAAGVKAKPAGDGAFKVGEFVLTADGKRQRPGRVVGAGDGKFAVQFYEYTEKRRVELPADRLVKWTDGAAAAGVAEIEVEWQGQWWPAKVLKKDGDKTRVHYIGWGDEWDEWVPAIRIRPIKK